jgi:hypothetical protein
MATIYEKDGMMVGRKIADETVLVPISQNVADLTYMYTLNNVGSRIWELLDGGTTVEKIAAALVREYEVEYPQAEADVIEFLEQMKEVGAVVERTGEV